MPQPEGGLEYLGEGRFEESDRIPLQEYASWVLPGASLVISVPYSKSLPPGEYQAELVIEFGEQLPVKGTIKFRIAAQKSEPSQKKKYLPVCGFSPAGVGGRFRRILTNDRMIEKKAVKEGRRDENLSSAPPNSVRHPLIGPRHHGLLGGGHPQPMVSTSRQHLPGRRPPRYLDPDRRGNRGRFDRHAAR